MKKFLSVVMLLLAAGSFQNVLAQDIIMGSSPLVADIEDSQRYFYDPGGDGCFAHNLDVTMTLRTAFVNTQLYVLFEQFAIGMDDTLWIYDGASVNAPLLGFYNLANSPGEIVSTGRDMTFVFHSGNEDIPGLQAGWKAQVYAYDPQPMEVNYGEWTSVLTCNAVFYDAGGPNGNIGTSTPNTDFTEFTSPVGSHIKCEFDYFQVDGLMIIYDGQYYDPNRRLIGQFCSSTLDTSTNNMPPVLFSTTNTLCFVYVGAAGDVNKSGWEAHLSCVHELVEYEDDNPFVRISNIPLGDYANAETPELIELDTLHPIVVHLANVNAPGQYTHDYIVEQIPYDESNMFVGYNYGTSIVPFDDSWSQIQLPFTFSFFGKSYDNASLGTNGLISFDTHYPYPICYCAYSYGVPPSSPPYNISISGNQGGGMFDGDVTCPYNYKNSIYGVYEDTDGNSFIDKQDGWGMGAIRHGVLGSSPCRAFVYNFLNIGLYGNHSDNNHYNTYQMLLYEGTNIIDVYVKHRRCCAPTNSIGQGIIGLQNSTSSQILLAPERGMTGWSADNEAWRFTPITPPNESGELTWYQDVVDADHIISQGSSAQNRTIAVAPTGNVSYISE